MKLNIFKQIQKVRKKVKTWFNDRIDDIGNIVHDKSKEASEDIHRAILRRARRYAPDGSQNLDRYPSRYGQRPSDRLGNVPHLKEGLRSGARDYTTALSVSESKFEINISSRSPHIKFFTSGVPRKWVGGARPHRIPSSGIMAQRGYPMTFYFARKGMNWREWYFVKNHPGIDLNERGDFLEQAYIDSRPEIDRIIREAFG